MYEGKTLRNFVRAPDQWKSYEDQCSRIVRVLFDHHTPGTLTDAEQASGVAQGLAYLHFHQIVHGDINDVNTLSSSHSQSLTFLRRTS
jgi:serine/threonine protein kinase